MEMSEDLVMRVARTARNLHRRFPMIESDDIQSEIWSWILGHSDKLEQWELEENDYKLGRAVHFTGLKYCQREKAEILGYKNEDNYYYSIKTINYILSEVCSTVDSYDEKSMQEINDKEAVMDVVRAFRELPQTDRHFLYNFFTWPGENGPGELAKEWDTTEDSLRSRQRRVIKRIQHILGGEEPRKAMRRVMSNAQAQVHTREVYNGE